MTAGCIDTVVHPNIRNMANADNEGCNEVKTLSIDLLYNIETDISQMNINGTWVGGNDKVKEGSWR